MKRMIVASAISCLAAMTAAPSWSFDPKSGGIPPSARPPNEMAAQKALPKVRDELWGKISKSTVDYNERDGTYSIRLTPELRALDGTVVTLRGFVLPMDGSDQTRHFLISRNTPVCMFCPPGEPNEVVEVRADRAVAWTNKIVSVTGHFKLINDQEKALFFRIENAAAK